MKSLTAEQFKSPMIIQYRSFCDSLSMGMYSVSDLLTLLVAIGHHYLMLDFFSFLEKLEKDKNEGTKRYIQVNVIM